MKKFLLLSLMIFAFVSCDKTEREKIKKFKVAIILPGVINDQSWSQAGYEGGEMISKNLKSNVKYYENTNNKNIESVFASAINEKSDLIIAHGSEFLEQTKSIAEKKPETKFVVTTKYSGNNRNLGAVHFQNNDIVYLLTELIAEKSKTKKIAFLAGEKSESTAEVAELMKKIIVKNYKDVELIISYVGSWSDKEKTLEKGKELISQKVDIIVACLDSAGDEIHKLAEANNIHTIGWTKDRYNVAPKAVITSIIESTPIALFEIAKLARSGHFEGKLYRYGLREGAVSYTPFRGSLTKEEEEKFEKRRDDLLTGKLKKSY